MKLTIRVESGKVMPQAGFTMYAEGFAGTYEVKVKKVLTLCQHPDGAMLVDVQASRRLVLTQQQKEEAS